MAGRDGLPRRARRRRRRPRRPCRACPGRAVAVRSRRAAEQLRAPRVGLYKPWAASMDEGWTRLLLEQYGFEPKTLDNKAVRAGDARREFDVIVLPDVDEGGDRDRQAEARRGRDALLRRAAARVRGRPREGGRGGAEGVRRGGRDARRARVLVRVRRSRSSASRCATRLAREGRRVLCPRARSCGSRSHPSHPVTSACPARSPPSWTSRSRSRPCSPAPRWSAGARVAIPAAARDVLLSGWIRGEEELARSAAAVALTYGKGKVVLLGFRAAAPRADAGTFPFLFNALYWSTRSSGGGR